MAPHAPYDRSDNFNYSSSSLKPIWQWNHNPDDTKWSLKKGRLRLQSMPAEQLMWARNTLTQRVIGPKSIATVELYVGGMKEGDVAGLGNINVPCSWIGIEQGHYGLLLRCYEQATNDTVTLGIASCDAPIKRVWLRMVGDFDHDKAHYEYSLNGEYYRPLGREMPLSYQLITFRARAMPCSVSTVKASREAMPSSTTSRSWNPMPTVAVTFPTARHSASSTLLLDIRPLR